MMVRLLQFFKWLCLLVCFSTQGIAQIDVIDDDDISQIPQRPVNHILDAARWFTLNEKESMGKELGRIFKENGIDLYVVTLTKQPPQGAQTYARKLGETWSRSAVWCVVFHVPDDPSGFHVEAGAVETKRERIDQALVDACKRARRENSEKDRVMAAWRECSEGLRFIHASGKRYNERVVEAKKGMRIEINQKSRFKKIILGAVGLSLLILSGLGYAVNRMLKRRAFAFKFPETSWRTRFQGPHSGGGGIVIYYRGKRLK